jgi:DNA-binding response OmpR family regulator
MYVPLAMGSRALDILGVLTERPGELVSRAEIIAAVWPGTAVEDSNLNVQIASTAPRPRRGANWAKLHPDDPRARLSLYRASDPARGR